MVANLKSLVIPLDPLPQVDTSWLGQLTGALSDRIDKKENDQALSRLGDAQATGQVPPAPVGFFSRLLGGQQQPQSQAASIPAPAAQQQLSAGLPAAASAPSINAAPDATGLNGFLSNPTRRASLPAGMRNNNPGNIKFVGQNVPGIVGPSQNTDEGDPQAVFATPEAGMAAMHSLLLKKYNGGKVTADQLIAGNGGWTPGNHEAAANVARYAGLAPNQDINLNDPSSAAKFMRGLMMQEHGNSSRLYPDSMIASAVGLQAPANQVSSAGPQTAGPAVSGIAPSVVPVTTAALAPAVGVNNGPEMEQGDGTGPTQVASASPQPSYIDPQVTTAAQRPAGTPAANLPPQINANPASGTPQMQVAQAAPAQQAGPQTLAAGVSPVTKGSVSPQLIQQMLKDPQLNKFGLELWRQNATGSTATDWDFVKLDDGTLARANKRSGEVQSLGNFQSGKKELLSNGKGSFYDSTSGQWITPPAGAGGDDKEFFGTTVPYYDAQGNLHQRQLGKDGNGKDLDFGPGGTAAPTTRTVDTGTELLTIGPGGNIISRTPKDVQGEAFQKKVGTDTGEQQAGKVAAGSSLNSTLSGLDRLADTVDSISSDPALDKVTGWESKFPSWPGGEAAGVQARLNSLKSQVGFNVLQAMRDASKTGGALGNVSDAEQQLLQNNLAALDQAQSVGDFKTQLGKIKDYVAGAKQRLSGAYRQMYNEDAAAPGASAPAAHTGAPTLRKFNPATGMIE